MARLGLSLASLLRSVCHVASTGMFRWAELAAPIVQLFDRDDAHDARPVAQQRTDDRARRLPPGP